MDDQTDHRHPIRGGSEMMQGYYRRGENRPALTGRAARRSTARTEARAFAKKHSHRIITHIDRATVAASRAGWLFAGDYLRELGVDDRFSIPFGKACAKAYRANHNTEPDRGGKAIINGRIRPTFRYSNPLDLIAGALAYPRTTDLVLRLPAGHPVARQFAGV